MKNFVLVGPIFPYTFYQFAIGLKQHGFRVLVIGDVHEYHLSSLLKDHLDAYYYVRDMNDYGDMQQAMRYFIERFGPIDYLESNIEHWLKYDAQLREDFDVRHGLRPSQLRVYQSKSAMKQFYQKAQVPVASYQLITTLQAAIQFAQEVGYPVFVKPDTGVGSQASFKLKDEAQLMDFFARKPDQVFIIEEFIEGDIYSFDGMSNATGDVVFYTAHHFPNNIASIVNEDAETYYVTLKEIPEELILKGKASVKAFGLNQRFFHFEFFKLAKDYPHLGQAGSFIALEANLRPPGGFTMEMINYANSVNAYHLYAEVMATNTWKRKDQHPTFYCAMAGRKNHHQYRYDFQKIRDYFGAAIVFEHAYPYPISIAMGDYFFLGKFTTRQEVESFFQFVLAK